MIPRSEWTSRPPNCTLNWGTVVGAVVHWTGLPSAQRGKDWRATMRAVQNRDMDGPEKMCDIEYNLGVPLGAGDYVELRGLGSRGSANGQTSTNAAYPSILVIAGAGDILDDKDIGAVQAAVASVRAKWPAATKIVGHRDIRATQCPGEHIYGLLTSGRLEPVAAPPLPPPPVSEVNDMARLVYPPGGGVAVVSAFGRRYCKSEAEQNWLRAHGEVQNADPVPIDAGVWNGLPARD